MNCEFSIYFYDLFRPDSNKKMISQAKAHQIFLKNISQKI